MKLLARFRRLLAALKPPRRWTAIRCEELPETLRRRRVYLVGDRQDPWSAGLLCPCGCNALIQLSLVPNDRPSWRATVARHSVISLRPSIWRKRGCCSHFTLRGGQIDWAQPGPPPELK